MYNYRATIIKVIDGDTIDLSIDLGLEISKQIRVRLYGVDTPELHSSDPLVRQQANKAKEFVQELLPEGNIVRVDTFKDKTEKYGRYLVNIFTNDIADVRTVNDRLIAQGLAKAYLGGAK